MTTGLQKENPMAATNLVDTPQLTPAWKSYPGMVGKMAEDQWVYMNLEDHMLSCIRGCLFTVSEQDKRNVLALAEELNENDLGCQFAMVFCTSSAATLVVEWESYKACKQTICGEQFVEKLNHIKCDFYLTHIGISTSTYRECIRKQIKPGDKIVRETKEGSMVYFSGRLQLETHWNRE